MTEQASPLITFYKHGWEHYQQALVTTIASLSSEQLTIPLAPDQRSLGELSLALGTHGLESFYTS
jgi:hypothetical protein